MRNILVLGASSPVGAALSKSFSGGNRLLLTSRRSGRLEEVAQMCDSAGAIETRIFPCDLGSDIQPLMSAATGFKTNLIIDAASGASATRDGNIKPEDFTQLVNADLCAHLQIYAKVAEAAGKHPDVIFISSVLAIVRTPDREVYSSLKRLMELHLLMTARSHPDSRILIFRIGKVINALHDTEAARDLALLAHDDFYAGRHESLHGSSGRILATLQTIHPALVRLATSVQRKLRRHRKPGAFHHE